ncbi:MAG: hypothetical protein AB7T06_10840 [Kofleriaceae bacterium]
MHWIVSLLSLGVAASSLGLWLRAPKSDARELVLRDEAGRARIRLVATGEAPRIELLDAQAHVRASLTQATTATSLRLYRQASSEKAIELVVLNGANGPAAEATVSAYSYDGKTLSTLGAGDSAWTALRTSGGQIRMSQESARSEIGAVYVGNSVKLVVSENDASFSTRKPFAVDVPAMERTTP